MADDASACAALAPRRLAHRGHSLALSGPSAAPRMLRATRRGLRCSATAASKTSRTAPACCPPGSRVLHRRAADAAALRRRLPALSTEQTSGGTAFHQLQEVCTSQRKHRMLPQFTQLCAAQRTGHATQSRPSVWPRGCLRKAWQHVRASSAAMPSARASEERGHNHFWNPVSPPPAFFSFYALAVKRTVCGRRRLGRYPILRLTSSLRCARGGAAAGWIEKAQSAERLQACRGARCSFSDRAAGGVSAGWRGEA